MFLGRASWYSTYLGRIALTGSRVFNAVDTRRSTKIAGHSCMRGKFSSDWLT